mgnify:CR=1 FL=1
MDAGKKGSKESLEVLRAKYHDYCSAQVADLLVYMSPDEIYLLAHRAYREEGGAGEISYVEMVVGKLLVEIYPLVEIRLEQIKL